MPIRKAPRNPIELDTLALFAALDEGGDTSISTDTSRVQAVLDRVADGLKTSVETESRLHGWRVQTMFVEMILGLGEVRLLTVEDAGEVFYDDADGGVKVPDFRLVTRAVCSSSSK